MKFTFPFPIILLVIIGCSYLPLRGPSIHNNLYKNKMIGFKLRFDKEWQLGTTIRNLPPGFKKQYYDLKNMDLKPLFFGYSADQTMYVRSVAEKTGIPLDEYSKLLFQKNNRTIGLLIQVDDVKIGAHQFKIIDYSIHSEDIDYTFRDYITNVNQYKVQITFWTFASVFQDKIRDMGFIMATFGMYPIK